MLKELRLANLKIFEEVTIQFGAITVLIGQQGTGKSTILQSLQLLQQSAGREGLNLEGPWIKDAQFRDLIHDRNEREILQIGLQFKFLEPVPPISAGDSYGVTYDIVFDNKGFKEHRAKYEFQDRDFGFRHPRAGRWDVPPAFQSPGKPDVNFYGSTYTLAPFMFKVDGRDYLIHQAWMQVKERVRNYFMSMQIVPAERLISCNRCPDKGSEPLGSLFTFEDVVNKMGYRSDIRDDVSSWLREILDRRVDARRVPGSIVIETYDGSALPVMNDGAGVRQLIWLLTALVSAEPGSMILIEEPEIHLHPAAQAKLCHALLDETIRADKQLMITTHSEHILMALVTAVTKRELSPDELAIYLCMRNDEVATVERLEIDSKGRIKGGLPGFFEASLDELENLLKALAPGKQA